MYAIIVDIPIHRTALFSYIPHKWFSSQFNQFSFWPVNPLDPPEKVSLQILSKGPIIEGENVTLKCQADGNPAPTSFFFHIKVSQSQKILSEKCQERERNNFKVFEDGSFKNPISHLCEDNSAFIMPHYDVR